jgi:hypothetical protein
VRISSLPPLLMQNAEAGLANPQATVDETASSRNNTSKTRRIVVAVVWAEPNLL